MILSPNRIIGNNIEELVLPPGGGDPCLQSTMATSENKTTKLDSFQMENVEKEGAIFVTNYLGEKASREKDKFKTR